MEKEAFIASAVDRAKMAGLTGQDLNEQWQCIHMFAADNQWGKPDAPAVLLPVKSGSSQLPAKKED